MQISLGPEDEVLIKKRLDSGAFSSVEDVIHRALEHQEAVESWLDEDRDEIAAKIDRGLAQLDRGEAIPAETARELMQGRKRVWLDERSARE